MGVSAIELLMILEQKLFQPAPPQTASETLWRKNILRPTQQRVVAVIVKVGSPPSNNLEEISVNEIIFLTIRFLFYFIFFGSFSQFHLNSFFLVVELHV
jgi:hypothetical protein